MADICAYMWRYSDPHGMGSELKRGRLRAARDGKEACYEPLVTVVQDFSRPVYGAKRLH